MTALRGPGNTPSEAVAIAPDGSAIAGNSEVSQGVIHATVWRRQ
jgi:uncharacterized membrane protein